MWGSFTISVHVLSVENFRRNSLTRVGESMEATKILSWKERRPPDGTNLNRLESFSLQKETPKEECDGHIESIVPGRVHRGANKELMFTEFHKICIRTIHWNCHEAVLEQPKENLCRQKLQCGWNPSLMILQIRSMD